MPSTPTTFRHTAAPRNPLSHERLLDVCYAYKTLYEAFLSADGEVTSAIYEATMKVEREIIWWEQRSATLRYAAKRQAAYRAAERDKRLGGGSSATYDEATDTFVGKPDSDEPSRADLPETTQATLDKFKVAQEARNKAPDTSVYKNSGLV
jgi:hypothetical protein